MATSYTHSSTTQVPLSSLPPHTLTTAIPGLPGLLLCFVSSSLSWLRHHGALRWGYLCPGPFPHGHNEAPTLTGRSHLCLKAHSLARGPVPSHNIQLLAADLRSACELILGDNQNWVHSVERHFHLRSLLGISPLYSHLVFCPQARPISTVGQWCVQTPCDSPAGCNSSDAVVLSQHGGTPD